MSTPIYQCWIFKAAQGDEITYKRLIDAIKYNIMLGVYSQFPCRCNPPCKVPTEDELKKLNARVKVDIDEYLAQRRKCKDVPPIDRHVIG